MKQKIILAVLLAFIIAFSSLFVFLFSVHYELQGNIFVKKEDSTTKLVDNFFSKGFSHGEKKVFLLGSSHIKPLNTTYIQNYLLEHDQNYTVYNLAVAGDTPKKRLDMLDLIISAKPDIIVYGVADRDFSNTYEKSYFLDFFLAILHYAGIDLDFLQSPQFDVLRTIEKAEHKSNEFDYAPYPNTPFINITADDHGIQNDETLKELHKHELKFYDINAPALNLNEIALKNILLKLKENNIRVVLFTTPQQKYHIDDMPDYTKTSFNLILDDISNSSNITINSMFDKYENLSIWTDNSHVAITPTTTIYSKDVAKLILDEAEK